MENEIAIFGAGCFWHVEYEFSKLPGVIKTEVGYMGGDDTIKNISYENVCSGKTGHIEVTRVTFNNRKISYEKLLNAFWKMHDPATKDRQGPDIGIQYKSVIFYTTEKQKKQAERSRQEQQKILRNKKIFTEIIPASVFHRAEEYHQKYLEKQGKNSCNI